MSDLKEANLEKVNLKGAILRWAYLREADLKDADLEGAVLQWAYLRGANLEEANLKGAVLQWAYLIETNLRGANLVGANLVGAYGLSLDQLSKVKTLYNTKLDEDLLIALKEKFPVLFEKPDYDE